MGPKQEKKKKKARLAMHVDVGVLFF